MPRNSVVFSHGPGPGFSTSLTDGKLNLGVVAVERNKISATIEGIGDTLGGAQTVIAHYQVVTTQLKVLIAFSFWLLYHFHQVVFGLALPTLTGKGCRILGEIIPLLRKTFFICVGNRPGIGELVCYMLSLVWLVSPASMWALIIGAISSVEPCWVPPGEFWQPL